MAQFRDYHRTIIGYHGTRLSTAEAIIRHEKAFEPSTNKGDWLGHGIYFWEYAPKQAWLWAKKRYKDEPEIAVLGAMIRLGNCLDLLEPANAEDVRKSYKQLKRDTEAAGEKLPRNHNANKPLDCAVFQYTAALWEEAGQPLDTIRGVYVPTNSKDRLWERSWLYQEAHIQLCVRNPDAILGVWLMKSAT